jgi:TonB family protein
MLLPTLNALAFLHGRHLVQGQLKPSNILVVGDQLKLASDTIRPAGESSASIAQSSVYDPPEARDGSSFAVGDIWSLGITVVEALTQHPPEWPDKGSDTPFLPTTLPPAFAGIVRRCLNRSPAKRPLLTDLEAHIKLAPQASLGTVPRPEMSSPPEAAVSFPQPVVRNAPDPATPPQEAAKHRLFVPALTLLITILVAVWAGLHLFQGHPNSKQPASSTSAASRNPRTPMSAPPEVPAPSANADSGLPKPASASRSVLHEEIPAVPRSARETIRGHITVAVRVSVDSSGKVVAETLENPGPSKYFAHLASAAARKWKFAPADNRNSRKWLLRFQFTRGGTTAHATTRR